MRDDGYHLIDAEMSYVYRLTGAWPERPWPYDEAVSLDVLQERATLLAATLDDHLAQDEEGETSRELRVVAPAPQGLIVARVMLRRAVDRGEAEALATSVACTSAD